MKKMRNLLILLVCAMSVVACKSDDDLVGDWEIAIPFPAKARLSAVSFSINGTPYVGLGLDENANEMNDFWVCNAGEAWARVTPFPGGARYGAVAFSDGTYGYVGLGWAERINSKDGEIYYRDFWRFDPNGTTTITTNDADGNPVSSTTYNGVWTEISAFPGESRKYAIAFFVGGKGYVGTGEGEGSEGTYNDYYTFDPAQQSWDATPVYVGQKRKGAVAWVMGNSAYVATGVQGTSDYVTDVLRFTPGEGWKELDKLKDLDDRSWDNDYGYIPRAFATVFVVGNESDRSARAYIATGAGSTQTTGGSMRVDVWEYNPYDGDDGLGRWDEVTGFPRAKTRYQAVSFVLNGQGFVTLGASSGSGSGAVHQSTYKFWPGVENDEQNDD